MAASEAPPSRLAAFCIDAIDDKAAQLALLKLSDKEHKSVWQEYTNTVTELFVRFGGVPTEVRHVLDMYC